MGGSLPHLQISRYQRLSQIFCTKYKFCFLSHLQGLTKYHMAQRAAFQHLLPKPMLSNLMMSEGLAVNPPTLQRDPNRPKFTCTVCDKQFTTQSGLQIHMQHHTGKYRFNCDVCSKGFTSKHHYTDHMRTKHEGCMYVCEFCNKSYSSCRSLETHLSKHTGKYAFYCDICESGFNLRKNLEIHKARVHGVDP